MKHWHPFKAFHLESRDRLFDSALKLNRTSLVYQLVVKCSKTKYWIDLLKKKIVREMIFYFFISCTVIFYFELVYKNEILETLYFKWWMRSGKSVLGFFISNDWWFCEFILLIMHSKFLLSSPSNLVVSRTFENRFFFFDTNILVIFFLFWLTSYK